MCELGVGGGSSRPASSLSSNKCFLTKAPFRRRENVCMWTRERGRGNEAAVVRRGSGNVPERREDAEFQRSRCEVTTCRNVETLNWV